MKGRTYVENNIVLEKERERQLQHHRKRIEEIQKQADKRSIKKKNKDKYNKEVKMMKQMHDQRRKDFEFKNLEKIENMNKENQILLNRLLEISTVNHKSVARGKKK